MRYFRRNKGQSLLEYSLILAAIVVAIVFMQTYVRRGVQGRLKDSADQIGDQYSVVGGYNYLTNRTSTTTEETDVKGKLTTDYTDVSRRTGSQRLNAAEEPWEIK